MLIRRSYRPPLPADPTGGDAATRLAAAMREGTLTAEALLRRYCTLVYRQCGSYQEAARRLGLDRRTVRSKVEELEPVGPA